MEPAWSPHGAHTNQNLRVCLEEEGIQNLVCCLLNGIDTNIFRPLSFHEKSESATALVERADFNLVWLSRLEPEKGWDFMLSQLGQLEAALQGVSWKLHILGDGGMFGTIKAHLAHYLDPSQYHMYGVLPHSQVAQFLQGGDAFISCSTSENLHFACLEALACGLPVIAPAKNKPPYLEHGINCLLFTEGHDSDSDVCTDATESAVSFVQCVVDFATHLSLRQRCAQSAVPTSEPYSIEKVNSQFQAFIEQTRLSFNHVNSQSDESC